MTGSTIVRQGRRPEFLPVCAMTAQACSHSMFHLSPEFIPVFDLAVTESAVDPGERMPAMIEKNVCVRGETVDPPPGNFLPALQVCLDPQHLRRVRFHNRMATHTENNPRNRGLTVFLGARMAEDTLELLSGMLAMAEGNGLDSPVRRAAPIHKAQHCHDREDRFAATPENQGHCALDWEPRNL